MGGQRYPIQSRGSRCLNETRGGPWEHSTRCPADSQPRRDDPTFESRHESEGTGTTEFKVAPYEEEMSSRSRNFRQDPEVV